MTAKTCSNCGCKRVIMIRPMVQEGLEFLMSMNWFCFPCLFKILTHSSLQELDPKIYNNFMKLIEKDGEQNNEDNK